MKNTTMKNYIYEMLSNGQSTLDDIHLALMTEFPAIENNDWRYTRKQISTCVSDLRRDGIVSHYSPERGVYVLSQHHEQRSQALRKNPRSHEYALLAGGEISTSTPDDPKPKPKSLDELLEDAINLRKNIRQVNDEIHTTQSLINEIEVKAEETQAQIDKLLEELNQLANEKEAQSATLNELIVVGELKNKALDLVRKKIGEVPEND